MTHDEIKQEITRIEARIEALTKAEIPQLRTRLHELRKLAKRYERLQQAAADTLGVVDMHKEPT